MTGSDVGLLQLVTPMPPARSGIAQYSRDLVAAVGVRWAWQVYPEPVQDTVRRRNIPQPTARDFDPTLPAVFQIGNSDFHPTAFEWALRSRGVLVLHDVVLHHGRVAEMIRRGRGGEYRRLMLQRYGHAGLKVADQILRGQQPESLLNFPLSEDFVEHAAISVVHSPFALELVRQHVPGADVEIIPMGIPLPALVPQADARRALGLPQSAFVVASVTHVNPYKRLPIVLRALRRVVERVPETILVVAGSVAPGIDLQHIARLYNVESHVRLMGYVSDDEARLVARASDVCVNLRYPTTGETSASLLRLLGSGRPVIVTDDQAMTDYPRDAVIPLAVDRFEDETLAEFLMMLSHDGDLRIEAGNAARRFVEQRHSMQVMVDAYQRVIGRGLGISLSSAGAANLHEAPPLMKTRTRRTPPLNAVDARVVHVVEGSGVGDHLLTLRSVVRATRELGLHRMPVDGKGRGIMTEGLPIRQELLDILACPVCKARVKLESDHLVCTSCQRRYRIDDGIPVMLPEEAG
jgi:glycosyltransferase involved in cell wall biosynthesis/uncharacterized protein YbaR (Trm112 family)